MVEREQAGVRGCRRRLRGCRRPRPRASVRARMGRARAQRGERRSPLTPGRCDHCHGRLHALAARWIVVGIVVMSENGKRDLGAERAGVLQVALQLAASAARELALALGPLVHCNDDAPQRCEREEKGSDLWG